MAILMIVLMHTSCNFGMRVFTPCGGIGVAMFLILSGYGLSESFKKKQTHNFWKNKFTKIWVPYAVVLSVAKCCNEASFEPHVLLQYLCIDSPYWYVSFLFYNYLLFYACHKVKWLYKYRYILFVLWGCMLFLFDTRIRAEQILSFVSGMWLSENKEYVYGLLLKKRNCACAFAVLLSVSTMALVVKQLPSLRMCIETNRMLQNGVELLVKYPFALLLVLLLSVCMSLYKNRVIKVLNGNRFLAFCSTISLELYIVHFSLIPVLDKSAQVITMLLFLLLSFSLSVILHYSNKYLFLWKK